MNAIVLNIKFSLFVKKRGHVGHLLKKGTPAIHKKCKGMKFFFLNVFMIKSSQQFTYDCTHISTQAFPLYLEAVNPLVRS